MSRRTVFLCVFALGLVVPLTSCLDLESLHVAYVLDSRLSGSVEITYTGIHSDREEPDSRIEEMKEFYEDLPGLAEEQAFIWGIKDKEVVVKDKTDTRCDVVIKGEIGDFLRSLVPLLEDGEFAIEQTSNTLSCTIKSSDLVEDEPGLQFSIAYSGTILSHNAHTFDAEKKTMTWVGGKLGEEGIRFQLQIE